MINDDPNSEKWHQGCYCGLWEEDPGVLKEQGVPKGYCGLCDSCGKPGHTMHFPGSAPYTGSWCKYHYYKTMILHPAGGIGAFIWAGVILSAIGASLLWILLK